MPPDASRRNDSSGGLGISVARRSGFKIDFFLELKSIANLAVVCYVSSRFVAHQANWQLIGVAGATIVELRRDE